MGVHDGNDVGASPFGLRTIFGSKARAFVEPRSSPEEVIAHAGPAGRLGDIVALEVLHSATSLFRAWDGIPGTIVALAPPDQKRITCELRPARADLVECYRAAFSLHMRGVERWIPPLAVLCRKLEAELGLRPGGILADILCSGPGAATRPRFDPTDALAIQVGGEQRWSFARERALRCPPAGHVLGSTVDARLTRCLGGAIPLTMPAARFHVVARPGTAIFVPSGTLHSAVARHASVTLSFTVAHASATQRLTRLLRRRLEASEGLRAPRLEQRDPDTAASALLRAASELRRMARDLERGSMTLGCARDRDTAYRLREDLTATRTGEHAVQLRTSTWEKTVEVDGEVATILGWANERHGAFGVLDLVADNAALAPSSTRRALLKLVRANLLQRVAKEVA